VWCIASTASGERPDCVGSGLGSLTPGGQLLSSAVKEEKTFSSDSSGSDLQMKLGKKEQNAKWVSREVFTPAE